ncbi:phospholipase D-like domain-containing protein [Limimaricola variabilis]|uniref:phospholipase D-like domain-containing protein n=1 Tax=Limimaricola variabilis TaxID=1492771 RepID=UPI002AC94F1C|nr:phospholipase D-like domain-containing protein [Limimaricola variabilis]WPY95662.1 phospholipase D-like domain-containing protein [Limimaricola variabilis]
MAGDPDEGDVFPLRERRGTPLTDTDYAENNPAHERWGRAVLPDPVLPADAETPMPLITAEQAYPVLERCFLEARDRVRMSFRVFDPFTQLHSVSARKIGDIWFDLIAHKLREGLKVEIAITDFDPIAVNAMHAMTWDAMRGLIAAGEASGHPERLTVRAAMHPARVGAVPRVLMWYKTWSELRLTARRLNGMPREEREEMLSLRPGLGKHLTERGGKLVARLWPIPELYLATHHQKFAVFDDKWLYIGGLDLDDRRYDTLRHDRPAQETWHDVQLLMGGDAVVADAHRHLDSYLAINCGAQPQPTGRILRTISAHRRPAILRMSPKRKVGELFEAHRDLFSKARDLIYIETQFMRDRDLARDLARAARANPGLGLVMVLPAAPEDAAFSKARVDARYGDYLQARCIRKIRRAFGNRALIVSPAVPRRADAKDQGPRARIWRAPIIYVHAKVTVADGRDAIVSSANLNGRSMHWDTEAGVRLDGGSALQLRDACMRHWLGEDAPPAPGETGPELVARWRGIVEADRARVPELRQHKLLPYPLRPAWRLGRNLPGVPEAMV